MDKTLLICGAGGHGKVVFDVAVAMQCYKAIHFLDDNQAKNQVLGHQVIGKIEDADKFINQYSDAFVALGNNQTRLELTNKLIKLGYHLPILIHPTSVISQHTNINNGTVIMPMAVINADVKVGKAVIINTNAIIEHDCIIGDGCHILSGAIIGGGAQIGDHCLIDLGVIINRNTEIKLKMNNR